MNTLGSHPGAILFRLSVMVILILILIVVFLSYAEDVQIETERASILQTKRVIDSSLAVVFASLAVKGRLDELADLEEANPFDLLREFGLEPPGYRGVVGEHLRDDLEPGWYYLQRRRRVAYKARFLDTDSYFKVSLAYDDLNRSGRFESREDRFRSLQFVKTAEIPRDQGRAE